MSEDKYTEIPTNFYQDSEKKPFTNCTFCNVELKGDLPYMIEKNFKINLENGIKSTVFEYAICMPCSIKKMNAMSKESVQNIQRYMQENVLEGLMEELQQKKTFEEKIAFCAVTGKSKNELSEYSMVGQFVGNQMLLREFPLILSHEVGEEMQNLLSEHTKREFDKFMDTITGIPPELRSLFRTKRPIIA